MSPAHLSPTTPGTRPWAGLAVLMLPVLLISIDNTVLTLALPRISVDLATTGSALLWIVNAYSLSLAGLLVTMGNLSDRIGRRRLLLIGATGFAAFSLFAAFAPSTGTLIAARVALGVFGAMMAPSTLSLIRNIFTDRAQRRTALAIWASCFAVGAALGPLVGGLLLEYFHWGSVFLIAIPLLLPLLVLAPRLLPESRDPDPAPLSLVDVTLSIATLTPLVYAIKTFSHDGLAWPAALALAVALLAGALFVHRQLATPKPMLDLRLFSRAPFTGSVLANLLAVFALNGFLYFVAQHLQLVVGLSPLGSALVLLPGTVALVVAGLGVVPLARRWPEHGIVPIALLLSAIGFLIAGLVGGGSHVGWLAMAFVVLTLGIGATETLSNDIIIASVPKEKSGAASAISETAYEMGTVLGVAVLGSLLGATYRSHTTLPEGLSPEQQAAASETLGGAVNVASELAADPATAQVAEQLLATARSAFDSGVTWSAGLAAALMVVAAAVTWRTLRR